MNQMESLTITAKFPVSASEIYDAWLDGTKHSEMTGGEAQCAPEVGSSYSAWDGSITGENLSLTLNKEIVQTWRTSEFGIADEDSHLVISFRDLASGCEMTITHTNIPAGQTQYQQGWVDHYIEPMKAYFR
jgi:activator of HSP90 ATPase